MKEDRCCHGRQAPPLTPHGSGRNDRLAAGVAGAGAGQWDFNRPFTEAGWPDAEGDPEALWTDHVHHLYAVIDLLRAAHPHLRIESCGSGGARLDPGILARTDQVWTSDITDALDRLDIQHGFSQLYPPRVMGAWVIDSPNPYAGRSLPLDFRFHVAMAGVLAVGGELTRWSEAELARAAELVAAYKRVRPLGTVPG